MRGPDRRRGGSPPPPPMRRGDDRRGGPMPYPPPPPARRRGRSPSPPPMERGGFRRSPPPKRFRHDDDYDRFGPPPPRYDGPPPFDRRGPIGPPPPYRGDRYDDRYRDPYDDPYRRGYSPPPPPRRLGPMPYKEFISRELPDDITPEDAQKEFQAYLARWWGSEVKAQFESQKNDAAVRRRFDPREHQKAVDQRNAAAVSTAATLLEDVAAGKLDATAPDFNQGNGAVPPSSDADEPVAEGASPKANSAQKAKSVSPKAAKPKAKVVPEAAWLPSRVASDLALARELASKLDAEKGIADNSLLTSASTPAAEGDAAAPDGEAAAAKEDGEGESLEEQTGRMDVLLTYLWRVHGIDYYGGAEVSEPEEDQRNGPRPTLRCPRPEEGEQQDEAAFAEQAAILESGIDSVWRARLSSCDPFEAPLKKEAIEKHMEEWIDSQIVKIDEKKWGSKVSQKLFVDREYVVKHIRNKHPTLLEAERSQFLDELYFENFKAAKDEEDRLVREAAEKARREEEAQWGGGADWEGGDGGAWGSDAAAGGFAPMDGLPAPFVGGGGRGMAGGMMDVPAGCVLVPAPGAGPMGPFIPVPIEEAAGRGRGMGGPGRGGMGPGRGGRGGRGPMGGPLGGRGGIMVSQAAPFGGIGGAMLPLAVAGNPRMNREYVDLDDPRNTRSVLDYGDL